MSVAGARPGVVLSLIFATILLDFVGFSILIPVLPLYAEDLGASKIEVGLILSLYSLGLVLFLPFWGWVSDRIGRRPVILFCLLGTTGYFGFLAVADSVGEIYVARALGGFFGASIGTAQAYITDITAPEDRARGMGLIGAAFGLGFVLGNVIGGVLHDLHPILPFLTTAGLALVNFLVAFALLPESRPLPATRAGLRGLGRALIPTPLQLFAGAHSTRMRLYLYLFFHIFAAFSALEAMFPLWARETFGWGAREIGLYLGYLGVIIGGTQLILIGRLTATYGEVPLVILGLAFTGISMVLLPLADSLWPLVLVGAGVAFGNGIAFPTFTSLFSKACGVEDAGEFLGHSQSMAQTGRALGPYWGGWAMGSIGGGAPLFLGGLGVLSALGIFLLGRGILVSGADVKEAQIPGYSEPDKSGESVRSE
jgi:MFS family permease